MIDSRAAKLVASLADPEHRTEALQALAVNLGCETAFVFVEDDDVDDLVPAPGTPQTTPGGPMWRAFLRAARRKALHEGEVGFPTADRSAKAISCGGNGVVVVLVGGNIARSRMEVLCLMLPLLGATLKAEQAAAAATGELRVARQETRQMQAMARSLDATLSNLAKQAKALDSATRAKDEFLAMLGHELRNPLAPIVTALHVMRLRGREDRELDILERQVAQLSRLVDDLLDVSRIARGSVELRTRLVELSTITTRAIEAASPLLEAKRQRLHVEIPESGHCLLGDPDRLAQVFSNLLTNASRYSGPNTSITIRARRTGSETVEVRVIDEGVGIEEERLEIVFERFVQQPQSIERSHGGLGLGLAIARNLVNLHHGRIWAHSEGRGRGSEFVVELPLQLDAPETLEEVPLERFVSEEGALDRGRVLIVDDNVDAAEMLETVVDAYGYDAATAKDGPTALAVASSFFPQVAVLDIGLPVMDGYELGRRLREVHGESLHLIALTGYGQPSDAQRSRDAGFQAHLVKPVDLEELRQLLDELLGV